MPVSTLEFKNKKVLLFGLGSQGGGVATANWLIKQGAILTITDLKNEEQLASSLAQLSDRPRLVLGGHNEALIRDNEIIVVNPDVPPHNSFIQLAQQLGKTITNEVLIFYNTFPGKIIGVTGTRGKTTTTHWINHFLKTKLRSTMAGNAVEHPFLKILAHAEHFAIAVAETPSFQLEFFDQHVRPPDIAVITNLFIDHLNFHGSKENYYQAKANLFKFQTADQSVIFNFDNVATRQFLLQLPPAQLWLFSAQVPLPSQWQGIYYHHGRVLFQTQNTTQEICALPDFIQSRGEHNLENLLASMLASHLAGLAWDEIVAQIPSLPEIEYRQQVIFHNKQLTIINDTTATSPEGGMAALRRFAGPTTILIAGGTDRQLDYSAWANQLKRDLKLNNVIFLSGSATDKMLAALNLNKPDALFETLSECVTAALKRASEYTHSVILFSPAAKSFEKFQNEFDRGRQFNKLVKTIMREES